MGTLEQELEIVHLLIRSSTVVISEHIQQSNEITLVIRLEINGVTIGLFEDLLKIIE